MTPPALPLAASCDQCDRPIIDEALLRHGARRHRGACWTRWRTERSRRYYHDHREARIAYVQERRSQDSRLDALRAERRRKHLQVYGLTEAAYRAFADAQGGVCAICRQPETRLVRGVLSPLSVDHDHSTGRVRGLLCARCNSVLGFIEKPSWLAAAGLYLQTAQLEEEVKAN